MIKFEKLYFCFNIPLVHQYLISCEEFGCGFVVFTILILFPFLALSTDCHTGPPMKISNGIEALRVMGFGYPFYVLGLARPFLVDSHRWRRTVTP